MSMSRRFGAPAAALAAFLAAASAPADDPKKGGGESPAPKRTGSLDPELFPSPVGGRPFELVIRGDRSRFGRFDVDGNFIPEPYHESLPPYGPGGGPISFRFTNHIRGPSARGEHRSGRLIFGTMVKGVFIPEIGSKVLDIKKDFDFEKPDRIVWNLHDKAAAKYWTEKREKEFPNGFPNVPEPPPAGVPAGWMVVPGWKLASGQPDWRDVRVIGTIAEFGHLDERGEFIPDYGLPIVSRDGIKSPMRSEQWSGKGPRYYTLPQPEMYRRVRWKGQTDTDPEDVYEFRSGRLIKGKLQVTGNFIPEIGSTIIDFADYDPIRDRPRIYNLPGVLRRAE